jgi:tRNA G37 N-methylase TrmD
MWFGIISIFPKMFDIIKDYGITSYAYKKKYLILVFLILNHIQKKIYIASLMEEGKG